MKTTKKTILVTFSALLLLSFCMIWLTDKNILTLEFLNGSGEYLTGDPVTEFTAYHDLQRWIYLSEAAYLSIKILLVSITIYTALYLKGAGCTFTDTMLVVMRAEFIFVLAALIKSLAFTQLFHPGTLADWHRFHPLSALSIIGNVGASWYYPLQTLNLFEIAYWFMLAWGIYRLIGGVFDRSLQMVLSSYVPALFLWTLTLSFFSVVVFPDHI
ncbi:hypothetical protein [Mucilaginibacter sp. SJ]|uniref:hypothetical protein n=1 Tax=Mucilaginibacter sp. SJ TaxID=3029053 RepID=UPI0023A93CAE|nr:hypothetical protein [Mucilaginibacter sp. SJ]WEA01745.1 hypothetical protein MusilaSJ_02265 [Mucilaginibacter sp. SJ]